MTDTETVRALLREHIHTVETQWNLGTFGAIAEFMRDPDEACEVVDRPGLLSVTTALGGIGFGSLGGIRLFASESATGASWNHRVALCLPETACAMSGRTVLTELGPDEDALRAEDRASILFDMGLGTLQADICIRTADPALIAILRAEAGRPLFTPGSGAMGAILAAGPHRVFVARLGRCEVYQPIPPADGRSPEGPHTHVLPKLQRSGRTHAATEPVPDGFVPCAHLVPAHPTKDAMGRPRALDAAAFQRFENLLHAFGDPARIAVKQAVIADLSAGRGPEARPDPGNRFARHSVKVALRQQTAAGGHGTLLKTWLAAFDAREAGDDGQEFAEPYAH
ncbi:MAG: DUF6925 family protein [Bosea sp. (in: a-proteobacteria)]|uniref:DUF6925 family protein n=1 Tax=Bosea sp. (in: a-proteobacteria) TaxID=1871050 RepID=UPI003F7B7E87